MSSRGVDPLEAEGTAPSGQGMMIAGFIATVRWPRLANALVRVRRSVASSAL